MLLTRNVIAAGAGSSPSMSANTPTGCGCTCPACSGLQSFCRPRFFAGQLLTDKDLNCLENYLVNKNKLHNRYLVGWGVACGMQVMCSPCQGMVTVRAGYAVSPCGEDIVVPCDATVDICSLISQCNAPPTNTNCPPMRQYPPVQCNNMPVTWLLTIRYIETPSRGITPLSNSSSCQCGASTTTCSNCGSKASASGGCGCGSGSASAAPSTGCCGSSATGYQATASTNGTTVIPGAQTQCQPTQLCEGYVFELCPAPSELTRKQMCPTTNGPLAAACLCLQNMVTGIPAAPGPNANQTEKYNWLCELQNYLYNLLASIDLHDCSLFQTLGMITIPTPGEEQFNELYVLALGRLRTLLKDQIYNCICLALLPPCPATVCDDRVVLATVTVSGSGGACQVTDVCNFSNRNFLVTMETLAYWFGDLTPLIKKAFAGLCCRPDKSTGRDKLQQDPLAVGAQQSAAAPSAGSSGASPAPAPGGGAAPQVDPQPVNNVTAADPGHIKALSTAMAQSFLDPSANINLDALVAQALGLQQDNAGTVTPAQAADPVHYMLANFVLGPAAQSVFPDMSQVKRDTAMQAQAPSRTEAARDLELTQVQSQVAELTATVQRQDEMINQLLGLVKSQQ